MNKLIPFICCLCLSCMAQQTKVPLNWNYNPGEDVRFYLYSYSAQDASAIDSAQIVLQDSLDSSGLGEYSATIELQLKDYTCFFARAARLQPLKVYSRFSNRTIFIKETDAPVALRIAD